MEQNTLVIELHYLPCIQYMHTLLQHPNILFEGHEHFTKQTWRNRCRIYGANGPLDLVIPVVKKSGKIPVKDLQIAYAEDWQHNHHHALVSAYRSSPYFQYFEGDFRQFYTTKEKYLLDFNLNLLQWVEKALKTPVDYTITKEYVAEYKADYNDARNTISPKSANAHEQQYPKYMQVFEGKHGFITNLSIADWIFNDLQGARDYFKESLEK